MEGQRKEETMNQGSNFARINRNLIERNRRMHMKGLFSKLFSLIPNCQNSKLSVPELLGQATVYTKQLQEKIEKMKERKKLLMNTDPEPQIDITYSPEQSTLEVTIISGLSNNFFLYQVINILEDEGAEVVSTTYRTAGGRVFYRIYSQAISSRIGIETSRVDERLKKLIS